MTIESRQEGYAKGSFGLHECSKAIREWAVEKGFEDDVEKIRTSLVFDAERTEQEYERLSAALDRLFDLAQVGLIVSELGELVEAIRKPRQDDHVAGCDNGTVEIADAIVRLLHLNARRHDRGDAKLKVDHAMRAKLDYNEGRPYKHGKEA